MSNIEIIKVDFKNMPAKVPQPANFRKSVLSVASWIRANPGQGRKPYSYVRFHQDYDGEILQTVYAVKWCKPTKTEPEAIRCQLIFAGTPTRRWASGNLLFTNMSGYFVLWDKGDGRENVLRYYGFDPTMYEAQKEDFNPGFSTVLDEELPEEGECNLLSLRNWPAYMDVYDMMNYCTKREIIDYVKAFQKGPMLERMQKAGISYLWNEKRLMNAKPKAAKKLLTYIKNNIEDIRGRHPTMSFIANAMRLNMTIDQYEWHEVVMAVDRLVCGIGGYFMHEQANEVAKYLQKQRGGPVHYRDYLNLSAEAGRDMDDRGVLFPRDFVQQFDEMYAYFSAKKSAEMENQIKEQLKELQLPMSYSKKKFEVRILDTQKSMTEIGNELHNCVGVSGYGKRMANGEIVVLAVYYNGKPINCVEMATPHKGCMYRVLQNRGDHNLNSSRQYEVETFLAGYVREANKAWRQCHAGA